MRQNVEEGASQGLGLKVGTECLNLAAPSRVVLRVRHLLLLLIPCALRAQYSRPRVALVLRGEAALQRQEIAAAVTAFSEAARDSTPARRAAAERMLGVIAWRFYEDQGEARVHFGNALATGADTMATLIELARLATAEGRYRQAFELADRARRSSTDDLDSRGAILQLGKAVTEAALAARLDGGAAGERTAVGSDTTVAVAVRALRLLVRQTPGRVDEAHQLLLASLIAGDGVAAREALDSYYLIDTGGGSMHSPIPAALAQLHSMLAGWHADQATRAERARLASALGRARFYDAAGLVAPGGTDILAYAKYCRRVAREANEYYRRTLVAGERPDALTRLVIRAERDLWPRLTWPGAPPRFFPAGADAELGRRFGALLQLGITGGYYDMHLGHVVGDERRTVTQYGKTARVTFVALDGMVTNGLQSWAWDDNGGHGGWQRRDTIVQVRPIFVEHALSLWVSADPARRIAEIRNIEADSAADWTLARADSIGYLPGVASRLHRDGRDQLIDSLRRGGVPDSTLGREFVRVASRLIRESSIIAHEGRHAIDDALDPRLTPEDREFRAKLSEIAFAERPKLVMSAIVHPNIGDATPHGRANARLMLGLIRWMRAHGSEIQGFNGRLPVLPQLPLLADAQLRRAFRSMDPLARGS